MAFRAVQLRMPLQADALRSMVQSSQAQAQEAAAGRDAASAQVRDLQTKLQASQERMAVLKEQLMTGQQAAEESEAQSVQEAVQQAEARLTEQLRYAQHEVRAIMGSLLHHLRPCCGCGTCRHGLYANSMHLMNVPRHGRRHVRMVSAAHCPRLHFSLSVQVDKRQRHIEQLEAQLGQQSQRAATSEAGAQRAQAALQRAEAAEASAAQAQEAKDGAEREAQRLQGLLDAKAAEMQSLEAAMGDLAYEAESARTAKLRCQQLQVWLRSCCSASPHACMMVYIWYAMLSTCQE